MVCVSQLIAVNGISVFVSSFQYMVCLCFLAHSSTWYVCVYELTYSSIWYVCFSQLTAMHGMSVFLISFQYMVCLSFSPHCNMSVFLSSPQCIVSLFLSSFQHPESQTNHWQGTSGRGPPDCRADLRTLLTPGCCAPGIHLIELSSTTHLSPPPPPPPTPPAACWTDWHQNISAI